MPAEDRTGRLQSGTQFATTLATLGLMRRLVAIASALFSATLLVVSIAGPAAACSCMPQSETEAFTNADAVFIGTLVGYSPIDQFAQVSQWSVSGVFKGTVSADQPVETAIGSSLCGLSLEPGTTNLVFAQSATETGLEAGLAAGLCGGTRPATADERPSGFPALRSPGSTDPPVTEPPRTTVKAPVTTRKSIATTTVTMALPTTTESPTTMVLATPPSAPTTFAPRPIRASTSERVWRLGLPVLLGLLLIVGVGAVMRRRRH